MLVVTVSAQIIIIPILVTNFNQFSVMFWLSNVLAGPIIAICIIAGFLVVFVSFASIQIAKVLAIPIIFLLKLLIFISKMVSNIPFSNLTIITPNIGIIIGYYLILIIILYIKRNNARRYRIEKTIIEGLKKKSKKILCIITIIMVISYGIKLKSVSLYVHFIDVGQGDCTLIITESGKRLLIDGGGSDSEYDVGENILVPYLLDRGIFNIDYVMISHFDSDHCKRNFYSDGKIKCKKYNNIKTN